MRHLIRLTLSMLIAILLVGITSAQQTAQRIQFATGATSGVVSGQVSRTDHDSYVFRAFAGQTVIVNATNTVHLSILDPDNVSIYGSNTDGYHSFILAKSGDYRIHVRPVNINAIENYTLELQIVGNMDVERQPIERIRFETGAISATRNGILQPNQLKQYAFYAFAGQTLDLQIQGLSFYVTAPDDTVVTLGPLDLQNYVLQSTGDYRITLYDASDLNPTSYTVNLTIVGDFDGITEPERIRFAAGAISGRVSGIISGIDSDQYVFNGRAGQSMTLSLSAGTMTLVSPTGIPLARGNVTGDVQYINQVLPESGDYYVHVFRAADEPAINYTLDLIIVN